MKTALYLGLFLLALFAAPEAYACPMCALNDKAGLGSWFILAGMLGTPFVVAGTAIVVMRKIGTQSVADSTSPQAK